MRRVLVVSAHYPPIRSSQATRAAKLLKHLPSAGWLPTVVCAQEDVHFGVDPLETRDIPREATVVRTLAVFRGLGNLPRLDTIPDHMSKWIPGAAGIAIRLNRTRRYDAMASLSFPGSSHVAALAIHLATRLPWLADFSDPWIDNPYRGLVPNRWLLPSRLLEREVLLRASQVGFANEELAEFMARGRPWLRPKTIVLPNCAEQSDFQGLQEVREPSERFTLVHVGSLYGPRQPTKLLEGFALFLRDHPNAKATLRLVGTWKSDERPAILDNPGVRNSLEIVPALDRRRALGEIRSADLLVLIDPAVIEPGIFLPLKLVEYLMSGRPILALTGLGASQRLVDAYRAGATVRWDDAVGIADEIARFFATRTEGIPTLRHIPELEAATVGRTIAAALDRIAA